VGLQPRVNFSPEDIATILNRKQRTRTIFIIGESFFPGLFRRIIAIIVILVVLLFIAFSQHADLSAIVLSLDVYKAGAVSLSSCVIVVIFINYRVVAQF
jgi:hypothetical protein